MREASLIYLLFNLVLILKQTEQNQTNLPKIKHLNMICSNKTENKCFDKH